MRTEGAGAGTDAGAGVAAVGAGAGVPKLNPPNGDFTPPVAGAAVSEDAVLGTLKGLAGEEEEGATAPRLNRLVGLAWVVAVGKAEVAEVAGRAPKEKDDVFAAFPAAPAEGGVPNEKLGAVGVYMRSYRSAGHDREYDDRERTRSTHGPDRTRSKGRRIRTRRRSRSRQRCFSLR